VGVMKNSRGKIYLVSIITVTVAILGYIAYICVHYFFYMEYKECLIDYTYEAGNEFTPLEDKNPVADGMVLAAETEFLKLYTNTKTTEIAVYDKRSREIVYSNPPDRAQDKIASARNKTALNSQLAVTYYDSTMTRATMYNYDYSVERGQFRIESLENGIRYIYLLGNLESPTGIVPPYITAGRLEEKVLSKLGETDARTVRNSYKKSETLEGFMELTSGTKASKVGLQKLNKLFEEAGYTRDDFYYDAEMASAGDFQEPTTFTIPLEYRLIGDKLQVSVPAGQIIETGTGKIERIDLLCFFGAAGMDEKGYILVPNGSGSLIYFNNGKKTDRYMQYVYGVDETAQSYTVVENTVNAMMPVFGIKRENSAIFAEITEGDTLAAIVADVSGNINSYNYVYPSFLLRGSEKVSVFGVTGVSADLPTLEKNIYDINYTVTYAFLEKENASYSGMANYYRNDLIKRGALSIKDEKQDSIPFYLDIVGGVKLQKSFLGVPYMGEYPMTAFDEAEVIIDAFLEKGITNLRVNYLGWFNGGYYHDVPDRIKVQRILGGKRKLEELNRKLIGNGASLFGDVAFQKVSYEAGNYNWRLESSQYYVGYVVSLGRVNPATLRQTGGLGYHETNYDVLSPKFLVRHTRKFISGIEKVDISGISLRDLGSTVASDKRKSNIINRQEAKQVIVEQLKKIADTKENIMINAANAYAWAFATDIEDAPANHNMFFIVDEEIPFYQMVIHGCIDYSGAAVNLSHSYDKQDLILHLVEFGLSPRFTLSYRNSSDIKYSGLNSFYSTQYQIWLEDAADIYHKVNEVMKHTANSTIIEHIVYGPGVKRITYDNGVTVYVNFSGEDAIADDVTVPAGGYVLKGVGE